MVGLLPRFSVGGGDCCDAHAAAQMLMTRKPEEEKARDARLGVSEGTWKETCVVGRSRLYGLYFASFLVPKKPPSCNAGLRHEILVLRGSFLTF